MGSEILPEGSSGAPEYLGVYVSAHPSEKIVTMVEYLEATAVPDHQN